MKTTVFTDLPLGPELQRALREADHVSPTPIQAAAIPVILDGSDLLGCAQTGTGKTAAFALPVLQRVFDRRGPLTPRAPQVLVLAPTRELAAQITDSFRRYGKHLNLRHTSIFGGVNQTPQVRALRQGVHILVATPGRLIDLLEQGHVRLDQVRTLVLDEADRMLDMGFLPPIRKIVAQLSQERQSLCFSATMPREIADLARTMLRDPQRIDVAPPSSASRSIDQKVLLVDQTGKRALLNELLSAADMHRVLVFTRTKRRADVVAKQLHQADIAAEAIHGDKSQNARTRALERFKSGRVQVLVATDVAARGIDVQNVSHVINYDLPHDAESYVHRIGRTGRASAVGQAITFCDPAERRQIRQIERLIGQTLLAPGENEVRRGEGRSAEGRSSENRSNGGQRTAEGRSGGHRAAASRTTGRRSGERSGGGYRAGDSRSSETPRAKRIERATRQGGQARRSESYTRQQDEQTTREEQVVAGQQAQEGEQTRRPGGQARRQGGQQAARQGERSQGQGRRPQSGQGRKSNGAGRPAHARRAQASGSSDGAPAQESSRSRSEQGTQASARPAHKRRRRPQQALPRTY